MTGAAVAATFVATATPALADSDITLNNSRGYMTYKDSVDVFEICDMNPDGYGVHGLLTKTGEGNVMHIDDGGDNGCDKQGYNVGSGKYRMSFFWDGGGAVLYSKYFSE
ncbi:hypothetical protein [Streptomyces sp. 1268]|uniref:hypothetical protein n=1 Tax=Streptomyces sp. 1268 TaxID=3231942 RepID=UPI0038D4FC35